MKPAAGEGFTEQSDQDNSARTDLPTRWVDYAGISVERADLGHDWGGRALADAGLRMIDAMELAAHKVMTFIKGCR
ncbi:MAG: hypothetical protein ACK4VZ_05170 [Paracoccaceae bacterium]